MEQYLERAIEMNNATSLPVIADCSLGYRDNDNILEMVRRYELAGIAAVTIEEKKLPKSNSLLSRQQELVPKKEFAYAIRTIKAQRKKAGVILIARVEAFIAGKGLGEALAHAAAYADAGADVILIHSRSPKPDEIIRFTKQWKRAVPLAVIPTTYYGITAKKLQQIGIKMVIYANHGLRAEIKAVGKTFKAIVETGSSVSVEGSIASIKDIFSLQRPPR
ncbi:MAG: isocitrate lyase/phosphoenolpyruvate mutase family protein, partial [Candidatus Omnitrophica bacterium]|nr:isocitrate lyase/phosphoenolpyruvate mutase family protein [Candidatus Omnitrophota bacterium]